MKFLIYREEIIDDKITRTRMSQFMIAFNQKLLANGAKLTRFIDGSREPKAIQVRNDERFKGTLMQGNYERWLKSTITK